MGSAKTKHTPGPWVARPAKAPTRCWVVEIPATGRDGHAGDVVYVGRVGGDDATHAADGANAHLIAAAPDMAEALKHLEIIDRPSGQVSDAELTELEERYGESLTWGELEGAVREAARAALKKAGVLHG